MRAYMGTPVALALASFATAAHAECVPSFVAGGNSVALTPAGSFEDGQLNERFLVRLRNDGDTICELRLAVGRDIAASDPSFPKFELFGPNGAVAIGDADGARSSARSAVDIVIPTGGETSIPYDVRMKLGWGFESGSYGQALEFFLLPRSGQAELGVQRTQLSLNIPAVARIRFAGAGNARGSASVEMGTLSPNAPSTSPPFAIRVLSTAGYQMDLQSENLGAAPDRRARGHSLSHDGVGARDDSAERRRSHPGGASHRLDGQCPSGLGRRRPGSDIPCGQLSRPDHSHRHADVRVAAAAARQIVVIVRLIASGVERPLYWTLIGRRPYLAPVRLATWLQPSSRR